MKEKDNFLIGGCVRVLRLQGVGLGVEGWGS